MREAKLKKLEELLEAGLISKEEYEKKKKEIEEMPEQKVEEKKEEVEDTKLKSDRMLIIVVGLIVLVFIAIFGFVYFTQEQPETIDDLHELNLKGKLKPEQGYLYKDVYSFVKYDNLWYVQLMSPKGTRFYNIQFRYGPKEVEGIGIEGILDTELFNNASDYYVTFNPVGKDFSHVASTGQIRLCSLILRVAQANFFSSKTGKQPVLLLDDVLLELDSSKREKFIKELPSVEQAFYTFLPDEQFRKYCSADTLVYRVVGGEFQREKSL